MPALNWIDLIIIGLVVLSGLMSMMRGFLKESLSLFIWFLAFWLAHLLALRISLWFSPAIETASVRYIVAFVVLFLGTVLIGRFLSFIIQNTAKSAGLSGLDRVMGLSFGMIKGVLFITVLVLLLNLTAFPSTAAWKQSTLIPYFQLVVDSFRTVLTTSSLHLPEITFDVHTSK